MNRCEEDVIDGETYDKLRRLIETLTHSGLKTLDEDLFKEIKKMCKSSSSCVEKAYSLILYQLKKKHSEIRYLAFQMCVELFKRSALFRELLIKDIRIVSELTIDVNPKKKLPPPKTAARNLERLAISTIKTWAEEFGNSYKELKVAYHYFKHVKKVNFQNLQTSSQAEEARQRREAALKDEKMKKLIDEINGNKSDIENAVTTLMNCTKLLVPSLEDFFISGRSCDETDNLPSTSEARAGSSEDCKDESSAINLKHFGITSNYGIVINANSIDAQVKIKKTEENSSVIQNAEDSIKLMKNKYLPMLKKWNQMCSKYSADNGTALQRVLELKESIENSIEKYSRLTIDDRSETESSDSEFEEVVKDDYESSVSDVEELPVLGLPPKERSKKESVTQWKMSAGEDGDPASALSTLKNLAKSDGDAKLPATKTGSDVTETGETSRKKKLLARAPKLPFDIDLYHWEDDNLTAPTLLSVKMDNPKFWGTSTVDDMDEIPNPEGVAALRTRVIEFSGKFEPVKWSCRAPLSNGKLCPRKDRFKCPFHGKIVPRDENGVRRDDVEDGGSSAGAREKKMDVDWQDPGLLEDIKKATGVDLKMPTKKGKGRGRGSGSGNETKKKNKTHKTMKTTSSALKEIERRKYPGLTDTVGKRQSDAYKRISKKIFKKGSLNRVAATLNKIDFVKHRDKFGDQFNYVYGT